jgi:hypothetical protein
MSILSWEVGNVPIGGGVYGSYHNDVKDRHKVIISIKSDDALLNGVVIHAHSPEEVDLQISGGWHPRSGAVGNVAGAAATAAAASGRTRAAKVINGVGAVAKVGSILTGMTQYNKYLTAQMWDGICHLSIPLDLEFHAYDDAQNNVWTPTFLLAAAAAPYEFLEIAGMSSGQLHAPGPTIVSAMSDAVVGDVIDIQIGDCLKFSKVVIESASVSVIARYEKSGLPIATKVNLQFGSYFCVTRQDLAKWFKMEDFMAQADLTNAAAAAAAKQSSDAGTLE